MRVFFRPKGWTNDGSDESHNSSDEETERWEREQIKKAVGQRKLTQMRDEATAYRQIYDEPTGIVNQDRYLNEDMDIEVVSQPNGNISVVPSFLNSSDGTLRRKKKYSDMSQLLTNLVNSSISRQEDIDTKKYQLEQYASNMAENRESILKLADANLQLERNFQLYQEMKFNTDTVLNCLDEKVG